MKTYNHTCGTPLVVFNETTTGQAVYLEASFDHGPSYAQIGDPCPICGNPLMMESLRPLAIRIDVDDVAIRAWEAAQHPEAWATQQLANSQGTYWMLQSDGQLSIYNHDPVDGGRLLAVLSPEATQRLGAFLAERGPAF